MFLSISTSSGFASVSLFNDFGILIKNISNETLNTQSKDIAIFVKQILEDIDINKITNIFVDKGPGSFTGIRTGISLAIGLSIFGIKISGISALKAINFYTNKDIILIKTINNQYYYQEFKENITINDIQIITKDDAIKFATEINSIGLYENFNVNSEMIGLCGIKLANQNIFEDISPIYVKNANIF